MNPKTESFLRKKIGKFCWGAFFIMLFLAIAVGIYFLTIGVLGQRMEWAILLSPVVVPILGLFSTVWGLVTGVSTYSIFMEPRTDGTQDESEGK